MRVRQAAARLRALLGDESDFATILRGAGLVVVIRVLASAVGFASVVLLARWMGSSQYGLYSFAIASMVLLAYPATLGLPGAAVRFVAQHVAAEDWQHVVGFMKASSWLAFGCGALIAPKTWKPIMSDALHAHPTASIVLGSLPNGVWVIGRKPVLSESETETTLPVPPSVATALK